MRWRYVDTIEELDDEASSRSDIAFYLTLVIVLDAITDAKDKRKKTKGSQGCL